jgi:hypothetical protein
VRKKMQALTSEEVEQAMERSRGAPDRLKAFYGMLDDMLWKKNRLKHYKEKANETTDTTKEDTDR